MEIREGIREERFLKAHGLDVNAIDREALLATFITEMEAGLAGGASSLMMIPSFISPERAVATDQPVAVLDAGGTNLRSARVTLGSNGKATIDKLRKGRMPGTLEAVDKETFFKEFADFAAPLLEDCQRIGFCFSYAAEALPNGDARLIKWSKQIDAPAIEGELIGAGLLQALAARGHHCSAILLNDTVATLLAGCSAGLGGSYSAYVGFILGTGTNTAYVERCSAITKLAEPPPQRGMAINVESGAFRRIEQSSFDRSLDRTTQDCGRYTFEKMISGGYLGALGYHTLLAAAEADLLPRPCAAAIENLDTLSTKQLDDFCAAQPSHDNPLNTSAIDAGAGEIIRRLTTPIFQRAAILTAVNLASAIIKSGGGRDGAPPVCVNVDGSTYYRTLTADFRQLAQRELRALLAPRQIGYELIRIDDAPIIGAAVAGLMR